MAFALGRGEGMLISDRNSDPASVPATGNYDRLLEFNLIDISLISDSPGRREREMPPQRKRPERWLPLWKTLGDASYNHEQQSFSGFNIWRLFFLL